jgi:hypothetical protein
MFTYYRNAKECYTYLNDVHPNLDHGAKIEALRRSKWFKRGWTLQELLAPTELYFLDRNWKIIGSKSTLGSVLSEITGIENLNWSEISTISVATRMSWASRRECTREEDDAYCLMGIFGINMPLLYGEGQNAFRRLQLEILKTSDDESLFAWWNPQEDFRLQTGLLATSPHAFGDSADISRHPFYADRAPYDMTNKGLQIEASLIPCDSLLRRENLRREKDASSSYIVRSYHKPNAIHRQLRSSDKYGNLPYPPSELAQEPRTWIFPLNCRIRSNRHPVVSILADWGTKSGQCCRLFSERPTEESFGPEWNASWRGFGGMTRLTYIREADVDARWILEECSGTPSVRIGLSPRGQNSNADVYIHDLEVYLSNKGSDPILLSYEDHPYKRAGQPR